MAKASPDYCNKCGMGWPLKELYSGAIGRACICGNVDMSKLPRDVTLSHRGTHIKKRMVRV